MESSNYNKGKIIGLTETPQGSLESLSEYTDAHEETTSAPTEFLAEFLSAVMIKDYETALKYCKLILQYEPCNTTARELYPLIIEKIQLGNESGGEDSSGDPCTDGTTASYSSLEDDEALEYDNNNGLNDSSEKSDSSCHKLQLLEDHVNGNNLWVMPATSSEESSPTEPTEPVALAPLMHPFYKT